MAEKNAPNTVTMQDGRVLDFPAKRKMHKSYNSADNGTTTVSLDFCNGESRKFVIPANLLFNFAGHGAVQKFGDEIAGISDIEDAVMAIDELILRLNKGEWTAKREASSFSGSSILARAIVEHSGKNIEAIKTFLSTKTGAEKAALRNTPAIKVIVDRLEAEKVAKNSAKVDTSDLLEQLDLLGNEEAEEAA